MTQTNTVERDNEVPENKTAAHLSIETIRKWRACGGGRDWFREKFPQGGDYCDVMLALYADGRREDANWLASQMLSNRPSEAFIKADVKSIVDRTHDAATTGDLAHAATTGDWAHAATTGAEAHAATTGDWAHAATTGVRAHAATTGDRAHAATTGDWAHAATTGAEAHAATTGDWAHAATTGVRAHAATTGDWAHAATTGDWAHAATTGVLAHAATTGAEAHAATTGDWAYATTTGDWAHAATTGVRAHAATTGENCIVSALGMGSRIKLGPNGCGDLHWHDGQRFRTVTIYAGENGIENGVWYCLDEMGNAVSVEGE